MTVDFKIQILVEEKWKTFDWNELNEAILLGNDFTNYRKRFWTGLRDKNGKEIYEGDVMCFERHENTKNQTRWEVVYNPESGFKNWHSVPDDAVVIGNIYENPELIK